MASSTSHDRQSIDRRLGWAARGARVAAAAAFVALAARDAPADLDFEVQNGATVASALSPADETETFRVRLAEGARLSVAAKPMRHRGAALSSIDFRVVGPAGAGMGWGAPSGNGARLKSSRAPASGEYRIEVTGDGVHQGGYRIAVAWTKPSDIRLSSSLDGVGTTIRFAADAGSTATISVRAARGSAALPRLVQVRSADGAFVHDFAQPVDVAARSHVAKGVALPAGGDYSLDVRSANGLLGFVAIRVAVQAPRIRRRTVDATTATGGGFVGVDGGEIAVDPAVGGPISGASIGVPVGALAGPTGIVIGPGGAFTSPVSTLRGGGPNVFFGPSGLRFDVPVTVRIPFDPTGLAGDFSSLRVYEREADGTVRLVPTATYSFDATARTVSFPVSGFTSFRAFAPSVRLLESLRFSPSDAAAGKLFGTSAAISGDTAVFGANFDADAGSGAGAAYVYVRSGSTWSAQQKLAAGDAAPLAYFGSSVAIEGDTAVVGASGDAHAGTNSGAAYVFTRSGNVWTQQQKLVASDGAAGQSFGFTVALSGDTLVVGASGDTHAGQNSGAAYVFERAAGVWTQETKLTASDGQADDIFGYAVDVDRDTVVVGAPVSYGTVANTGAAYVFTRGGGAWPQQAKLRSSDVSTLDEFGISVAVDGVTVIAGAYRDADFGVDSGSAYVFERTGAAWAQSAKLNASDAKAGEWFGMSVAVEGDTALVSLVRDPATGVDAVSTMVFRRSDGEWSERAKLGASTAVAGENGSLHPLGLSGTTVVVGAANASPAGVASGAAYVFDLVK